MDRLDQSDRLDTTELKVKLGLPVVTDIPERKESQEIQVDQVITEQKENQEIPVEMDTVEQRENAEIMERPGTTVRKEREAPQEGMVTMELRVNRDMVDHKERPVETALLGGMALGQPVVTVPKVNLAILVITERRAREETPDHLDIMARLAKMVVAADGEQRGNVVTLEHQA